MVWDSENASAPLLINTPFDIGEPIPWMDVDLKGVGPVNLEQFCGLRAVFVFLPTLHDQRCRDVLDRLPACWKAALNDDGGQKRAVVPVIADLGGSAHPSLDAWRAIAPFIDDRDLTMHRAFGISDGRLARIAAVVTDPLLVVRRIVTFNSAEQFAADILAGFAGADDRTHPPPPRAPVLLVPQVFSPRECQGFIDHWRGASPEESGYMLSEASGKQYQIIDRKRKSRRDVMLEEGGDPFNAVLERFRRRVFTHMSRYFQFDAVRVERFALARYAAAEGGHFAKHRDFTGPGSHREFAVTINLNADFAGGELVLPEFPGERFKPEPGTAIVYSGALAHVVRPITAGDRYCMLSFVMGAKGAAALDAYVAAHGTTYATTRAAG